MDAINALVLYKQTNIGFLRKHTAKSLIDLKAPHLVRTVLRCVRECKGCPNERSAGTKPGQLVSLLCVEAAQLLAYPLWWCDFQIQLFGALSMGHLLSDRIPASPF